MTESITFKEVLDWMDGGAPFSIDFVTCNKTKKTGGEWIHLEGVRKHVSMSSNETARLKKAQPEMDVVSKNPRHYENSTRNIMLANGENKKAAHTADQKI